MELAKLLVIFGIMLLVLLAFKKPLWLAAAISNLLVILLYMIQPASAVNITIRSVISSSTLEIVAVLYLVNLLQVAMESQGAIATAERAMLRLFNNRRVNIMASPVFMGMLPAPNAVLLSAPIVDAAGGNAIDAKEKAYVTSYLRHIPESALPLYPAILLAIGVTGLSQAKFLIGVIPMVILSFLVPYYTTVRKVPKETGLPPSDSRGHDTLMLLGALWPVLLLIIIVVSFGVRTSLATAAIVAILFLIYRIPFQDLCSLLKKAFNANMFVSMVLLMLFKDLMSATGVISTLPEAFSKLPIPLYLTYAIIMFIGGLVGLGNAMIAVAFPIAFATIPTAGIPLLILLLCFHHAAVQLSPTHICLDIAVKYFKVDFMDLMIKTIHVTVIYCVGSVLYYLLITAILK